jgi:hypothetical protein
MLTHTHTHTLECIPFSRAHIYIETHTHLHAKTCADTTVNKDFATIEHRVTENNFVAL